jgi:hypothetical protein
MNPSRRRRTAAGGPRRGRTSPWVPRRRRFYAAPALRRRQELPACLHPVDVGYSAVPSLAVTLTPSQSRITRGPARSRELPTSISKANDIRGAKRGANEGRRRAAPRDVWRRRVQLTGTSSYVRRRLATAGLRLTSEGFVGSSPTAPTRQNNLVTVVPIRH